MLPTFVLLAASALSGGAGDHAVSPIATPARVADNLYECPTKSDPAPFLRTPSQELIQPCRDDDRVRHRHAASPNAWRYVFHRAARVMPPRYGQRQQPLEGEGLLIYEGMKLVVDPDTGVYDLTFLATSPPRPVVLRMQLQFTKKASFESVRLTLPPIALDGDDDLTRPGVSPGLTVRVNHRGYSELFQWPGAQTPYTDVTSGASIPASPFQVSAKEWAITRVGTARFGAGLANADDLNR